MSISKATEIYRKRYRKNFLARPAFHLLRTLNFYYKKLKYNFILYLRIIRWTDSLKKAVHLPFFLQSPVYTYRGYPGPWFEHFFYNYFFCNQNTQKVSPTFIPILFDNFYLQSQSGAMLPIDFKWTYRNHNRILHKIGKSNQVHFTVLGIYDFPIWNWHSFPKNCLVFSANGGGDIPVPLLKGKKNFSTYKKDILVSFMGKLDGSSDSTGVRSRMYNLLRDFAYFGEGAEWYNIMKRSHFTLCPRGLGRASFRLYEALSVGSIPIYIWDDLEWLPYKEEIDWAKFAISVHVNDIHRIPGMIQNISNEQLVEMQAYIQQIYDQYFTYEGTANYIFRKLQEFHSVEDVLALTQVRKFS